LTPHFSHKYLANGGDVSDSAKYTQKSVGRLPFKDLFLKVLLQAVVNVFLALMDVNLSNFV